MNKSSDIELIALLILAVSLLAVAFDSRADDRLYTGVQITVPLSLDAVGVQVVSRHDNLELRAGIDSRGYHQIGGGLTAGDPDQLVWSAGFALSNFHGSLTPYAGAYQELGSVDIGVISYGGDAETTYLGVGKRLNYDNGGDNGSIRDGTDEDGGDGPGGDTGDNGDPTDTDGDGDDSGEDGEGDGEDSGEDDNESGSNRSGLGDGTNPGKGKGKDNSPNTGTNNPHN